VSQENVEASLRRAEAWIRGDWEEFAAGLDPLVFIRLDPSWPERQFSGREAVTNFSKSARELVGPDARVREVRDLGDRVLIRWEWQARGERSGIAGDLSWSQINTIRDGLVIFIEYFLDHAHALKAVGLES